MHAIRDDVDRYKNAGEVSLGLARALAALIRGDTINGIPVCKQFQVGACTRGPQCRYWLVPLALDSRVDPIRRLLHTSGISTSMRRDESVSQGAGIE